MTTPKIPQHVLEELKKLKEQADLMQATGRIAFTQACSQMKIPRVVENKLWDIAYQAGFVNGAKETTAEVVRKMSAIGGPSIPGVN